MRRWALRTVLFFAAAAGSGYELPADLRERTTRLLGEVEAAPTTLENGAERASILWEWANAVSLQGGFVPKNLPLVAVYLRHPTPGVTPATTFLEAVDVYVRQLTWLDRDPGAFGSVSVSGAARALAASWQTITVEWKVGSLGVEEGGGLLVSRHMMGAYGALQVADPAGENFVSISTSNPAVSFELDQAPMWGPYGGFRTARQFPVFRVRGADLESDETVVLVFGDRSQGGRGFRVGPFSNDAIALPIHLDPGDGRFYELPLPTFEVIGGEAFGVHGFAPSIVAPGESFTISLRTEDRYYNRASGGVPAYEVRLNGEVVGQLPPGEAIQELPLELQDEGVFRFTFRSQDGRIEGKANPIWVREEPSVRLLWGETHGHCGFAEGQGTPAGYFEFARDDARLDFVTLSEHDVWLTDGKWKYLNEVSQRFHREGELIVFPGYEWSSPRQRGGHHNVFFRRTGLARVPVQEAPDLTMLYRGLRRLHDPADVLIIPHAHQAGDWRLSDLDMESLIEIMSSHGTFEWFGQRYLENGYRVGFVGASDDHIGHPGYAPGHPSQAVRRSNIFQFGGLSGVWVGTRTTDAVFDALKERSAYATTGSQRIILDARLNGGAMGTQLPAALDRRIEGRAIGTAPIRRIDLIKNGEVVDTLAPEGAASAGGARSTELVVGFYSDSAVAFRDNPRGHRTWRGTLAVENARVVAARFLGTPHHTSDRLAVDGQHVGFDLATRGARRTFALTLEEVSAATRLRFELDETREMGTAPTQVRQAQTFPSTEFTLSLPAPGSTVEEVLEEGRYRDRVSLDLVTVDAPGEVREDVEFRFFDRGDPGDWYYIRVEQFDGHLAWSSPWWVGGEPPR